MTSEYRLTLSPKTLQNAEPKARSILERAKAQVGFIPNMYAVMANSPGLLETYVDGYDRFREDSGLTPAEQEVVFLTISRILGFNADAAPSYARIASDRRRAGRPISHFDAQIAAIALSTGGSLATRNVADFDGCGVTVVDPWQS